MSRRELARLRATDEFGVYDDLPQGEVLEVRSADGTPIHTEVFGPANGYPIVLSHGICCAIPFWANQIAALSPEYRVIAFDHRGHGRSGRPPADGWTVERLADDLDAVLRATLRPGERALIAGHSMGGITIQAWAHLHPENVARFADSVALINTTPGDLTQSMGATLSEGRMRKPLSTIVDHLFPFLFERFSGLPVPKRLPLRTALMSPIAIGAAAHPAARALIQELILTTPARTRGSFIRMLSTLHDGDLNAAALTPPTLVIGSRNDRLLGFAPSQRLAARSRNSLGLVELAGGHCGPVEHPDAVTAELRRLISAGTSITA
ncbi:alpha/beta fold hydrolase [Nocardia sp. NPDC059240]|uniref:alpha/beta fold hydrolase n=1 Tax=Nocardia sp. NPDC059240 TaxID=3346786 RepID=UPI0036C5F4BB